MIKRLSVVSLFALSACFSPLTLSERCFAAADEAASTYKSLISNVGPAFVTIKCVMKVEGGNAGMGEEGRDVELNGLMIEKDGLVLVSNAKMGGMASRYGMTVNPTDIKILIGDDTEGLKAKLLARDPDLDLCWIQIDDEKAKGKTFTSVDFSSAGSAELGDKVYSITRMGKFFDHALSVEEGRITGSTKKPRALLIPGGFSGGGRELLGAPLFSADGRVAGFNILQMPEKQDMEGGETGEGGVAILLLTPAEVVKATALGKEMAAKNPQPAAETKTEKNADDKDDKKTEGKPADDHAGHNHAKPDAK